jgi:hypothetical protein
VAEAWRDALASDADLENWCQDNAGGGLTVILGVDERDPHKKLSAPFVAIHPASADGGMSAEEIVYGLDLLFVLHEPRGGRTEDGNKITFAYNSVCEQFVNRALNVLAGLADYYPAETEMAFDFSEYPLVQAGVSATVNVPAVIGGGRTWEV